MERTMDLRHLETFRTVATEQSFTRAAETLSYAQSSVTAQIQTLEAELGVPLFDRIGKRISLTTAGEQLLPYAGRIRDLVEEARASVRLGGAPSGTLVIGSAETLCTYRLPPILRAFRKHYPEVQLTIHAGEPGDSRRDLASGEIDVAIQFGDDDDDDTGLHSIDLVAEPVSVVAAPDHPLAGKLRVSARELARSTAILTENQCGYRRLYEAHLRRAGFDPQSTLHFNSVEAIKQCVMAGLGISILPTVAVERELARGSLTRLNVTLHAEIRTKLTYRRDKWLSPTLRAFIDEAMRTLGSVRDEPAAPLSLA
jgi:DNA-binding transcriptional LysR family regulator